MARFAVRRLVSMLVVLFAISVLTFLIFAVIPNGDPAVRLAGRTATPETIAAVRSTWGFDRPIYEQYALTMKHVFSGDVISYTQQVNVDQQILEGLPATLSLALGAGVIWLALGIVLGLLSAVKAGRVTDRALTGLAMVGVSMPVFLIGALLLYLLAYRVGLFPNGGYVPLTEDPLDWVWHMILPWTALSVLYIGFYSRVLRSNLLDTTNEDFVRTARAKGLSERRVLIRHVLRSSLIPIVSLWGLDFAAVIGGGAILTESVFNLHGVGQYAAQSIGQLDVPPVLVIVMFGAFFVVALSAVTDIVVAALDPRIKLSTSRG
jgi:peptide/nickel transport system permease protein